MMYITRIIELQWLMFITTQNGKEVNLRSKLSYFSNPTLKLNFPNGKKAVKLLNSHNQGDKSRVNTTLSTTFFSKLPPLDSDYPRSLGYSPWLLCDILLGKATNLNEWKIHDIMKFANHISIQTALSFDQPHQ